MRTGFSEARSAEHDAVLGKLFDVFEQRGYQPQMIEPFGHIPDLSIVDRDGSQAYVDYKTARDGFKCYVLKLGSLEGYLRLAQRVYIVWQDGMVDTAHTVLPRIYRGPQRPNGSGSNTDFVWVKRAGATPFNTYFEQLPSD